MTFRNLLSAIFIATISLNSFSQKQPNVIIILSDDQGWGDVGFNGCKDIPTPHLDELANSGVKFSQAYASHSYCSPSRAGLLTGRYQQTFGHENNLPYSTAKADDGLPLNELMISELLQDNGYATCAIGKWHLGDSSQFWPNNRGFDDWFGFYGGGMSFWGDTGNKSAMHGVLRNGNIVPQSELSYLTDDFTNAATQYIDKYTKNEQPFFMYLAYNAPHAPIQATKEYLNKVTHIEDGKRAAYAAMVVGMDAGIGKVIDKLKETGEYDNTLIIFYSDNGGHLHGASNYPFRGHKGMLFEGGIRVPFLLSWPKKIKENQQYNNAISALDIYPTILAATQTTHPDKEKLHGVNLLPFINGENPESPHDKLFWRYSDGAGYAVLKSNYKMVMSGYKQEFFLFDLNTDPYEQNNLSKDMPNKLEELKQDYKEWNKKTIASKWQDPHAENILKEENKRSKIINQTCAGEKK